MEVQNKHANDINILIYQEKKIVWVAGLRKGRAKEFGRTSARVRGRKKKGSPLFPSRARKSLYLSEAYCAGQGKDSKRLGTLSARFIAKNVTCLAPIRKVDEMKAVQWRDANTKAFIL